ncbi:MAG: tripartite tricarboxylate transporter substrate binding protein [Burkholderiales bacterium]|nr:tripartite tricarboxylate transporter substrate binding protein [Burkholderiales bacterium]
MRPLRRRVLLAGGVAGGVAGGLAGALGPGPGLGRAEPAAEFPSRPLRLLIGFAPGGSADMPFRVLAEQAGRRLGQPIQVENRTGAGGTLPAQALVNAPPDGYTLAQIAGPVFRLPFTTQTGWNPATDFEYVIAVCRFSGAGLVVRADAPWRSIQDLVADARARPRTLTIGTPGQLTAGHLLVAELQRKAGVTLVHVPYRGDAESLPALLGGHVMAVAATPAYRPYVEAGQLRLLLLFDEERDARYPGVPAMTEAGFDPPDRTPLGIAVRKGTDALIVTRLHDALRSAMDSPAFTTALARYDLKPAYLGPAAYAAFVVDKLKREKALLAEHGLLR